MKKEVETIEFAPHDASQLRYVRRVETSLVEDGQFEYLGGALKSSDDFARMFSRIRHSDREIAITLFLDTNDMPIGYDRWTGGIDFVSIDPRQVFKVMAGLNAAKVVFCHNHPEGAIRPSVGDEMFCLQMCKLCELMGWEVVDFIVLGSAGHYSFKDKDNPNLLKSELSAVRIVR